MGNKQSSNNLYVKSRSHAKSYQLFKNLVWDSVVWDYKKKEMANEYTKNCLPQELFKGTFTHLGNMDRISNYTAFELLLKHQLPDAPTDYIESEHFDKKFAGMYLLIALKYRYFEIAKKIVGLTKDKTDLYFCDNVDNTPLILACSEKQSEVAVALINAGTNLTTNKDQKNELMYAIKFNMAEVVDLIIKTLVNNRPIDRTDAYDDYINSALRTASFHENVTAIEALMTNLQYNHDYILSVYKTSSKKIREVIMKYVDLSDTGFLIEKYGIDKVPKN